MPKYGRSRKVYKRPYKPKRVITGTKGTIGSRSEFSTKGNIALRKRHRYEYETRTFIHPTEFLNTTQSGAHTYVHKHTWRLQQTAMDNFVQRGYLWYKCKQAILTYVPAASGQHIVAPFPFPQTNEGDTMDELSEGNMRTLEGAVLRVQRGVTSGGNQTSYPIQVKLASPIAQSNLSRTENGGAPSYNYGVYKGWIATSNSAALSETNGGQDVTYSGFAIMADISDTSFGNGSTYGDVVLTSTWIFKKYKASAFTESNNSGVLKPSISLTEKHEDHLPTQPANTLDDPLYVTAGTNHGNLTYGVRVHVNNFEETLAAVKPDSPERKVSFDIPETMD